MKGQKIMKLRKKYFTLSVIFCILITFSSCNAQGKIDSTPKEIEQKSVGKIVTELDAKATLIYQQSYNYWFGSKDKGVYNYDGKSLVSFTQTVGLFSRVHAAFPQGK